MIYDRSIRNAVIKETTKRLYLQCIAKQKKRLDKIRVLSQMKKNNKYFPYSVLRNKVEQPNSTNELKKTTSRINLIRKTLSGNSKELEEIKRY